MSAPVSNVGQPDKVLVDIADYVSKVRKRERGSLRQPARLCLMDTLGCGLEALEYPACTKLLGPLIPGTIVQNGARVPGTRFELRSGAGRLQHRGDDPVLDFNDTWLAAEWGHPSDNLRNSRHGRLAFAQRHFDRPCATCSPR